MKIEIYIKYNNNQGTWDMGYYNVIYKKYYEKFCPHISDLKLEASRPGKKIS